MPRALEIPIEITRLDRAVDSVRRLSSSVRGVGDASRSSADALASSWGRSMERMARDRERYLRVSGPAQRLQRATAAREAAVASGDEARIFDANAAIARATVGMQRARRQEALSGGGGFMDRLTGVLASSRFNAGAISPLVGQTAAAAGIPMTGTAGLAFAGATAAVAAFTLAMKSATDTLGTFGDAMRLSGGTAHDVAGIARYGYRGAAGAQAAAAFRERISTDPMAQMYAARYGIRALPRPFGATNEAGLLKQGADALRGITNAEERLRVARVFGMEAALKYIDLSPRMQAMLDRQQQFEERLGGGAKAAQELSVATETLQRSWENLLAVVATPVIQSFADDLQSIAEILSGDWSSAIQDKQGDQADATRKNTDAMNQNTDAIKGAYLPAGTYGGGRRTGMAMPTGWAGDFLNRNMEAGALAKGMPGG